MRRLNGRGFETSKTLRQEPQPIIGATSGESPVLPPRTEPLRGPSGAVSLSRRIVIARALDLKFLTSLQAKFSNDLGFLPTAALKWYIENKRVGLGTENGEPAGYVLGRTHFKFQPLMRPITQACVAMDAQRRQLGMQLVGRVIAQAHDAGQLAVQAICAEDLEANAFWRALDFTTVAILEPDNCRGRKLVVWRRPLRDTMPDWFYMPPQTAGTRARRKGT